ncbi:hypothetical protein GGE66_000332 [Rhizobium leguminosarum]|uniref:Major facilitator superfamily (MFS) profile domain-containing protein n=1 Tax=Rhizobium leguminosarum TaxID=384 RepID=A0A7X0DQF8_RHILE|nr:hypothetical protein [Rhizobium leguminosarum]
MSDSASQMIFWRVVQAVGACSGVVLSRAMVRDLYEGSRAAQMLSTLITVMAVAPLLGPIVGGQVLAFAGWRAIFVLLVLVGLATLAALFTIPETLPPERRSKASLVASFRGYGSLLADRRLMGFAAIGGFFFAGVYAYIAGTPFAFIDYYDVPPQLYGVLFALGIVGIMLANVANARPGAPLRKPSSSAVRRGRRRGLRPRSACHRIDRLGWTGGSRHPSLRVRLLVRSDRRQFHWRRIAGLSRVGRGCVGAHWISSLRMRHHRFRRRQHFRRRHTGAACCGGGRSGRRMLRELASASACETLPSDRLPVSTRAISS